MTAPLTRISAAAAALALLTAASTGAQSGRAILVDGPTGIDLGPITQREEALAPGYRTGAGGAKFDDDEIIVAFDNAALTGQSSGALMAAAGANPASEAESPDGDYSIVTVEPGQNPETVAARLTGRRGIRYAQARYRVYADSKPNDPLYAQQWNFPLIDLERAWDINAGGSSAIVVAVLDTGVAFRDATVSYNTRAWSTVSGLSLLTFPSLGTVSIPFSRATDLGAADSFVAPRDFIWQDANPFDFVGHGTHVAGTIAQATNNGTGAAGVAYNVRIMPVKVLSDLWDFIFGNSRTGTDDVVAQGIRYAADNGANIINMSLGRSGSPAPVIEAAMRYAVDRGVFIAVSAGNAFEDGNPIRRPADIAERIEGVMAVAAVGPDRNKAPYSSTGSWVEIAAPGGNTRQGSAAGVLQQTLSPSDNETFAGGPSTYRAPRFDRFVYRNFQGTSMAAPHVAGLAALLMHQGVRNPASIERAIKQFATELGEAGRDNTYGHGLINARATLRGLGLGK